MFSEMVLVEMFWFFMLLDWLLLLGKVVKWCVSWLIYGLLGGYIEVCCVLGVD